MSSSRIIMLCIFCSICSLVSGQNLQWSRSFVTSFSDAIVYISSTEMSPDGGLFVSGNFDGYCDFDPFGAGILNGDPCGHYVARLSEDGYLLWVKSITVGADDEGGNLAVDAIGNSYLTGSFSGTVDCDPGPGNFPLTAEGHRDIYIVKLDPNGNFIWGQRIGSNDHDIHGDLYVHDNSLYCTGTFSGSVDFDNGPGSTILASSSGPDIFVLKLTTDGEFLWAFNIGSESNHILFTPETGVNIKGNATGDVYITGTFSTTGDFEPGTGVTMLSSEGGRDAFIMKLSNDNFQWVIDAGTAFDDYNSRITIGPDGSVYQCGSSLRSTGTGSDEDIFVARYTSQGTLLWQHELGGSDTDQGVRLCVDEAGAVYIAGNYLSPSLDFDPGLGQVILENNSLSFNSYLLKLTAAGSLTWILGFENQTPDVGMAVTYDGQGKLYYSGNYFNSIEVDPSTADSILTGGPSGNSFILKIDTTTIDYSGIASLHGNNFQIYPNPAGDFTTLNCKLPNTESLVSIYNLQGNTQLVQELTTKYTKLDLTLLPPGMYLVEISQNGKKGHRKLIKK